MKKSQGTIAQDNLAWDNLGRVGKFIGYLQTTHGEIIHQISLHVHLLNYKCHGRLAHPRRLTTSQPTRASAPAYNAAAVSHNRAAPAV